MATPYVFRPVPVSGNFEKIAAASAQAPRRPLNSLQSVLAKRPAIVSTPTQPSHQDDDEDEIAGHDRPARRGPEAAQRDHALSGRSASSIAQIPERDMVMARARAMTATPHAQQNQPARVRGRQPEEAIARSRLHVTHASRDAAAQQAERDRQRHQHPAGEMVPVDERPERRSGHLRRPEAVDLSREERLLDDAGQGERHADDCDRVGDAARRRGQRRGAPQPSTSSAKDANRTSPIRVRAGAIDSGCRAHAPVGPRQSRCGMTRAASGRDRRQEGSGAGSELRP